MSDSIFIGKSPYEADDIEKYRYLDPLWTKLNNTPETGLTPEELYSDIEIDKDKANKLMKELANEFIQKLMNSMKNPLNFMKIAKDDFYEKTLQNCWAFDKVMLLVTRVKGGSVEMPDNPVFNQWKIKWLEDKGM